MNVEEQITKAEKLLQLLNLCHEIKTELEIAESQVDLKQNKKYNILKEQINKFY